ncbi:MAG: restriction endonuclease subunit S, partial [Euryarchaeota archaeon]|nr:restriction endonuclease subunit S [Euryarchaeota archaeon]
GFIPEKDKSDARFVKYLFDIHLQRRYKKFTQGAAQDNLSQGKHLSLKFPVPGIHEQRVIADKLSAYDDLIENNRRRIQLLEQAARLLYMSGSSTSASLATNTSPSATACRRGGRRSC